MSYCREHIAVKHEEPLKTAITLKCKCWHCDYCAPDRKKQLIAECMAGAPCTFLTLTFRVRDDITPDQAAPMLSRAWRLIRLRLMRKYHWRKLAFIAVMEKTENGWPHIHILMRARYIPQQLISEWMQELCNSPIVHIEKINNKKRAAGYCAKYCSKAAEKFPTTKRYWQSQDYDLREPYEADNDNEAFGGWDRRSTHILAWAGWEEEEGNAIEWFGYDKAISYPVRAGPS